MASRGTTLDPAALSDIHNIGARGPACTIVPAARRDGGMGVALTLVLALAATHRGQPHPDGATGRHVLVSASRRQSRGSR